MADRCEMIVGFLVPHRCDNNALGKCKKCGLGFCDEHISVTTDGLMCMACQQGLSRPVSLPITAQTYNPNDLATFSAMSQSDLNEPESTSDSFSDLS